MTSVRTPMAAAVTTGPIVLWVAFVIVIGFAVRVLSRFALESLGVLRAFETRGFGPDVLSEIVFAALLVPLVLFWVRSRMKERVLLPSNGGRHGEARVGALRWERATTAYIWTVPFVLSTYLYVFGPVISEDLVDLAFLRTEKTLRGIWSGDLPFWDSQLGLGAPFSNAQDLGHHPLGVLLFALPLDLGNSLFTLFHVLAGLVFLRITCRRLGLAPMSTFLAVATYGLALPTVEFVIFGAYPSILTGWALTPLLVWLALTAWDGAEVRSHAIKLLLFAASAAFVFVNSHVGMTFGALLASGSMLLITALESPPRARRVLAVAGVGLLTVVLSADKVSALLIEMQQFPEDLPRSGKFYVVSFYSHALWHLFLRPVFLPDLQAIAATVSASGLVGIPGELLREYVARGSPWFFAERDWLAPFIGAPIVLLALHAVSSKGVQVRHKRALAGTFVVSLVIIALPPRAFPSVATGTVAFRDPLLITGILLGAAALSHLERLAAGRRWTFPREIFIIQLALLILGSLPVFYVTAWQAELSRASGVAIQGSPRNWLLAPSTRTYLRATIPADARVMNIESPVTSAQLLHAGVNVFGGSWFKGVSMEQLAASPLKMYARIPEDPTLISAGTLDVLGVGYVITSQERALALSAMTDGRLRQVGSFRTGDGRTAVVLRSASAWPAAVVTSDELWSLQTERRSGCQTEGLLCQDLRPLERLRRDDPVSVERRGGDVVLRVTPADQERTVVVFEAYRPGWRAESGPELPVGPVLGSLVGTRIPAAASEVRLEYRPAERVVSRMASSAALVLTALALAFLSLARIPVAWRPSSGGRGSSGAASASASGRGTVRSSSVVDHQQGMRV